ncbi:hypothetical protein GPECTOR_45g145 [Gonium pectorale]|uniref:Uncharacterized protein n=1 Tax=Gonium pectorale TaxID=33097 RepID=A0A150G9N5_GONPE|nr:hypothetical protein GPECTOR_45g145 [Gonium pectorale]|eukprot:KXZ46275.1 hypothetical protein GPECTOR_45g145 [Gonium pectorale]
MASFPRAAKLPEAFDAAASARAVFGPASAAAGPAAPPVSVKVASTAGRRPSPPPLHPMGAKAAGATSSANAPKAVERAAPTPEAAATASDDDHDDDGDDEDLQVILAATTLMAMRVTGEADVPHASPSICASVPAPTPAATVAPKPADGSVGVKVALAAGSSKAPPPPPNACKAPAAPPLAASKVANKVPMNLKSAATAAVVPPASKDDDDKDLQEDNPSPVPTCKGPRQERSPVPARIDHDARCSAFEESKVEQRQRLEARSEQAKQVDRDRFEHGVLGFFDELTAEGVAYDGAAAVPPKPAAAAVPKAMAAPAVAAAEKEFAASQAAAAAASFTEPPKPATVGNPRREVPSAACGRTFLEPASAPTGSAPGRCSSPPRSTLAGRTAGSGPADGSGPAASSGSAVGCVTAASVPASANNTASHDKTAVSHRPLLPLEAKPFASFRPAASRSRVGGSKDRAASIGLSPRSPADAVPPVAPSPRRRAG